MRRLQGAGEREKKCVHSTALSRSLWVVKHFSESTIAAPRCRWYRAIETIGESGESTFVKRTHVARWIVMDIAALHPYTRHGSTRGGAFADRLCFSFTVVPSQRVPERPHSALRKMTLVY